MPDIRYARNGGTSIAYHVVGDGPTDLVYVADYVSNLVYAWGSPLWRGFYERLARSFRLILFDKRGTGLSDSGREFPTLETRMEDVHAVLDAVGSKRAVVFGSHEGAAMATLYAATYPERTIALVLFQPSPHAGHWEAEAAALEVAETIRAAEAVRLRGEDYFPIFLSPEIADEIEAFLEHGRTPAVPDTVLASVLFTDIVRSTERARALGDRAWRDLLA